MYINMVYKMYFFNLREPKPSEFRIMVFTLHVMLYNFLVLGDYNCSPVLVHDAHVSCTTSRASFATTMMCPQP